MVYEVQCYDVSASMVGADATDSVARSLAGASLSPDESELHFAEPWFHRIVHQGRLKAEELLRQNADLGDGTFLVRPSEMFVGSYSLSFLRKGDVRICCLLCEKLSKVKELCLLFF